MFKYTNAFTNRSGDSLPGYFAKLYDSGGNLVSIYADANKTPISTVSGVANAALSDENGMFRWYVANGTYDIRFYDANDVFISVETGVPMFEASGVYTDLSDNTGAALVGTTGSITVQASLDARPTSATLAASGGAALVGFKQTGTGASDRTSAAKLLEISVSVDDFGAVGDGVTNDTAAVVAAQAALIAQGGGELLFTRDKTYLFGPVEMAPGVTYKGTGKSGINRVATASGAKLVPFGSSLFTNAATTIDEVRFENLFFYAPVARNAHIFNWSAAGVTAKIQFTGCVAVQESGGKGIIYGNAGGGVFSLYWSDGEWQYVDGATVPPISIVSPTVNSVVFENFWSTAAGEASVSGSYAIHIESTNVSGPAINVVIRDGVFEFSKHGAVKLLSCVQSGIENCTSYDLGVTPTAPMFFIGDGASAPPSNNCWMRGLRSRTGTVGAPDAKIDCSVAGQSAFLVEACSFDYLDGGNATPGILILGGDVGTFQNIAYTRLSGAAQLDMVFGTTDGSGRTWSLWNGYSGNNNGHLNIYQNGSRMGSFTPGGLFGWAGTASDPGFYVDTSGEMRTKQPLYPPTPAAAFQSATRIYADSAAPTTGAHTVGEIVFNNAPAAAGTIGWVCTTAGTPGSWKAWGTISA